MKTDQFFALDKLIDWYNEYKGTTIEKVLILNLLHLIVDYQDLLK